ncbi:hypothetical protein ABMY45_16855 [Pseudoalteromonas sp. XMcav11-Q]
MILQIEQIIRQIGIKQHSSTGARTNILIDTLKGDGIQRMGKICFAGLKKKAAPKHLLWGCFIGD